MFITQTNSSLNPDINNYGCNFRVLQAIAEATCKKYLTTDQVMQLYQEAKQKGWISGQCWVQDNTAIINQVFSFWGSTHKATVLGDFNTLNQALESGAAYIRPRWKTNHTATKNLVHFTLSNDKGSLFDPYNPAEASYSLHALSMINYRAFKVQ